MMNNRDFTQRFGCPLFDPFQDENAFKYIAHKNMARKNKESTIYKCIDYLQEQGYCGDVTVSAVLDSDNPAEHLCDSFATRNGGEVDHTAFEVVKGMINDILAVAC